MVRDKELRYICPKCRKVYQCIGWYRRHCLAKHTGLLPPIIKKVVDKRDIDNIYHKIDSLECKIDLLLENGVHDINIQRIKRDVYVPTSEIQVNMHECVQELKHIFSEGLNVLGRIEDIEIGVKSDEEIELLEIEAIKQRKEVIVKQ